MGNTKARRIMTRQARPPIAPRDSAACGYHPPAAYPTGVAVGVAAGVAVGARRSEHALSAATSLLPVASCGCCVLTQPWSE